VIRHARGGGEGYRKLRPPFLLEEGGKAFSLPFSLFKKKGRRRGEKKREEGRGLPYEKAFPPFLSFGLLAGGEKKEKSE